MMGAVEHVMAGVVVGCVHSYVRGRPDGDVARGSLLENQHAARGEGAGVQQLAAVRDACSAAA